MRDRKHVFPHLKGQTFEQCWIRAEDFSEVYPKNRIGGDVGSLLVEAAMDEDVVFDHDANVPKSVDVGQLVPIRRISIVDVQRHRFSHLVASAPDDH